MSRRHAVADEAQALLSMGEEHHSPTPPRLTCAAQFVDLDDDVAPGHPMHVCGLAEHHPGVRHCCKDCPKDWPLPHPTAHSRQITDRLLHPAQPIIPEVMPLSPTVEGTVTRDPASEAIATAARRLVHRTGQQITEYHEEAWRASKDALHTRIATRLESAGLSPAAVLKVADELVADVMYAAAQVDAVLCEQVDMVMKADVARNLLPRISKVMKETNHG